MKKILIFIAVVIFAVFLGLSLQNEHNEFLRKSELKTLQQKPDADISVSNNLNKKCAISENEKSSTQSDDFKQKSEQKADKSVDFISGLNTNTNNPYNITSNNNTADTSDNSTLLLAHLIESEAGDEPYAGKLAVASVVLNREKTDKENLADVVFQNGQFDGVKTKNFNVAPSGDSISAAKEVLSGNNVIPSAYYFADLNMCSPDFAKESTFIMRIGNHWFFKK